MQGDIGRVTEGGTTERAMASEKASESVPKIVVDRPQLNATVVQTDHVQTIIRTAYASTDMFLGGSLPPVDPRNVAPPPLPAPDHPAPPSPGILRSITESVHLVKDVLVGNPIPDSVPESSQENKGVLKSMENTLTNISIQSVKDAMVSTTAQDCLETKATEGPDELAKESLLVHSVVQE